MANVKKEFALEVIENALKDNNDLDLFEVLEVKAIARRVLRDLEETVGMLPPNIKYVDDEEGNHIGVEHVWE
jgi:hypothetical protein